MNARAPLKTIVSGNCWEHVHPDVIHVRDGFAGYSYWMAFTPYPLENDRFENPTIRASHDGINWQRVVGIPDPLVPPPATRDLHNADPELVYDSRYLHLVYATIRNETDEVTFNSMRCKSDLQWNKPEVIHKDVGAVSPTFQIEGDVWHEWFVRFTRLKRNRVSRSELVHRDGPDLASLGDECKCHVDIPGYVAWHVDVLKVENGYEALIAAFPDGCDQTRTRLFHLTSKDGITFRLTSKNPIIKPSLLGWDNRMIYRSSFLKESDRSYRIWYSAASWGHHCGIGLLQGPLDSLNETTAYPHAPVPRYLTRFPSELEGRLRYELRNHLPYRLLSHANLQISAIEGGKIISDSQLTLGTGDRTERGHRPHEITFCIVTMGRIPWLLNTLSSVRKYCTRTYLVKILVEPAWSTELAEILQSPKDVEMITADATVGSGRKILQASVASPFTMMLDDDTYLTPESLDLCMKVLEENHEIGAVGMPQYDLVGNLLSPGGKIFVIHDGVLLFRRPQLDTKADWIEVQCIDGGAMLYRTQLRDEFSFDEHYRMFEDYDASLQILYGGKWRLAIVPKGRVIHDRSWNRKTPEQEKIRHDGFAALYSYQRFRAKWGLRFSFREHILLEVFYPLFTLMGPAGSLARNSMGRLIDYRVERERRRKNKDIPVRQSPSTE